MKRHRTVINRSIKPSTAYGLKIIAGRLKMNESRAIDYLVEKELLEELERKDLLDITEL